MLIPRKLWGGLGNAMFQHAYIYAQMKKGEIPDIYVQDEKYFKDFAEDVRAIYGIGVGSVNQISIHVRRGDYTHNPFYVDLNATDYYERAIALFPDEKFIVFCADRQEGSDDRGDIEWCKEKFKGKQFEFFQGKDEIEDFNKMASCKGHICANSSFSWWASYIGGGAVVAPKDWFAPHTEKKMALPDNWKII